MVGKMDNEAAYWIERLGLQPHPEGGYFRQTYRSEESIPLEGLPERFTGPRAFSTAIYFLLEREQFSAFHRIRSDEMWHFYAGSALSLHVLRPDGRCEHIPLGSGQFQVVAPAGCWFAAGVDGPGPYGLVGCTVAPGFDFADFELAERGQLIEQYPQHAEIITQFTRS